MGNNRNIRNRRDFKQNNVNFRPPPKGVKKIKEAQQRFFTKAGPILNRFLLKANPQNPIHVKHVTTLLDRINKVNPYHDSTSKAKQFLRDAN